VALTFNDNGASPDTITRTSGSFVTALFFAGDRIKVSGTTSNNGNYTVATVAALTLTLIPSDSLTTEGPVTCLVQPHGCNGGNGGDYGSGGGGGGSSDSASTAKGGDGGTGANGIIVVVSHF
jgi:hypothetical protein